MDLTRRKFISTSAELLACTAASAGLQSCHIGSLLYSSGNIPVIQGPAEISLEGETALHTVGGAVKKRFQQLNEGEVIIIVRLDEQRFTAYAAQCTHWGAEVELPQQGNMVCPFHGSRYNVEKGIVIQGPAAEPLPQFSVLYNEIERKIIIGP